MSDPFLDLQNGFYNAFSQGLGFPIGSPFQILQPSTPLLSGVGADNALWNYLNNIPPFSLTQNFVASGGNQFYTDYRGLLSALQGAPNTFKQDIGEDAYNAWLQYLPSVTPRPTSDQLAQTFFSWAIVYYPDVANAGASGLATAVLDPVNAAQFAALAYPFPAAKPDWTLGYANLVQQLSNAPSRAFGVSTATMNSNVSSSWTQGGNSGFFGLWGGSSYESTLSQQFASSGVRVSASFNHVFTFQASPGSWYNSSAMGLAFANPNAAPWKPTSPINWGNTFDPNTGNMARFAASLIVADTMNIQVESSATFSSDDQQTIRNSSGAGLWPFYSQSNQSGSDTKVDFNNQGQMTVTTTSDPGIPIVLGVNVIPVGQFVGHSTSSANLRRAHALAA